MLPIILIGLVALAASSTQKSKKAAVGKIYKTKESIRTWNDGGIRKSVTTRQCKDGTFSDARSGACARHGGLSNTKQRAKASNKPRTQKALLKQPFFAEGKIVKTFEALEKELLMGKSAAWERKKGKDLLTTKVENTGTHFVVERIRNGKMYSKGVYSAEKFSQNIKKSISGVKNESY